MTFESLGISNDLCKKLDSINIIDPTKVQLQVIPPLSAGNNLLFQSETGTGKTFAYLLPLLKKINPDYPFVQLLIVAPTHELASQIKSQIQLLTDFKVALLIGGTPIKRQTELLKEKPLIVIGGPARLVELVYIKKLKLTNLKALVLDEVDRLISPELRQETKALSECVPKDIQFVACSATITKATEKRIKEELFTKWQQPLQVNTILLPPEDILQKKILHIAIYSESRDKAETLRKVIIAEQPNKAMIFTSRAEQVEQLASKLLYKKIDCCTLHAKNNKVKRKQAIDNFRNGKCKILITSDLSARGLDISGITHIIQMDLPSNEDFFIHRAGRTGRAGATGINIVIGDAYEMRKLASLEKKLKLIIYPKILYKGHLVEPIIDE